MKMKLDNGSIVEFSEDDSEKFKGFEGMEFDMMIQDVTIKELFSYIMDKLDEIEERIQKLEEK
jgi:hypothetical protein